MCFVGFFFLGGGRGCSSTLKNKAEGRTTPKAGTVVWQFGKRKSPPPPPPGALFRMDEIPRCRGPVGGPQYIRNNSFPGVILTGQGPD